MCIPSVPDHRSCISPARSRKTGATAFSCRVVTAYHSVADRAFVQFRIVHRRPFRSGEQANLGVLRRLNVELRDGTDCIAASGEWTDFRDDDCLRFVRQLVSTFLRTRLEAGANPFRRTEMLTLSIAIGSFAAFILAYHTYGRWLSAKIFQVNDSATVPSHELRDDVDFVPTQRQVLFGHHFTSIAGTGPIVGPAIAVFWGWLPALLWVVLGSIFVGAVHDFGALMVSLRNRGQTIGEVAGRLINPRARLLFLLILFFALTVVLAIFGLVIAIIFSLYPESVLSVWVAMPLALAIGVYVYRNQNASLLVPSLVALGILYASVYLGVYYCPITLPASVYIAGSPIVTWTIVLMIYCFIASVLPVWLLLQPRDYINSHQLVVALTLLVAGLAVAGLTGKADLSQSTPAIVAKADIPADAPPIMPFLFITIACGACSGFHCVVSSGTTSKQIAREVRRSVHRLRIHVDGGCSGSAGHSGLLRRCGHGAVRKGCFRNTGSHRRLHPAPR